MYEDPQVAEFLGPNEDLIYTGKFQSSSNGKALILTISCGIFLPMDIDEYWFVQQGLKVGDYFICYRKRGAMLAKKVPIVFVHTTEEALVQ